MEGKRIRLKEMTVNCPSCCGPIKISLEELNTATEIVCPNCGLKISITHDKSDKALKMLDKIKNQ